MHYTYESKLHLRRRGAACFERGVRNTPQPLNHIPYTMAASLRVPGARALARLTRLAWEGVARQRVPPCVMQCRFHEKVVDTLDKSEPHTHPEPSDGPGSLSVEEDAQALRQRFRELALSGSVKDIYHALQVRVHTHTPSHTHARTCARVYSLSLNSSLSVGT